MEQKNRSLSLVEQLVSEVYKAVTVEQVILEYTDDRTGQLSEMTDLEYWSLMQNLEDSKQYQATLREWRAKAFKAMRQYGIPTHLRRETNDWVCQTMGDKLPNLSIDQLHLLTNKLRKLRIKGMIYGQSNG